MMVQPVHDNLHDYATPRAIETRISAERGCTYDKVCVSVANIS